MVKFVYSLTFDDYLVFERFKLKRNRSSFFIYIMTIFYFAMGLYTGIASRNYEIIYINIAVVLSVCAGTVYSHIFAPKKRVKKMIEEDSGCLNKNEIIISENAIEVKSLPDENQSGSLEIYPYAIMQAIYETEENYYFFIDLLVKIVPKRAIPAELIEEAKKNISKNKNYIFIK